MIDKPPSPGSDEARARGCTCPVMDNAHGQGFMYGGERCYYMSEGCPLHGANLRQVKHDDEEDGA